MPHGHLLFVVSNVAGGINSRSSISRAVESLFPFKCLRAYKRQPSCPLLTTTMYVSPIHHGCGSLSLSSSIIMKKRRPIIKSRADYKIENFLELRSQNYKIDGSGTSAVTSSGIVQRRVLWTTASVKTFLRSSMMYLLDLQTRLQRNIFNATSKAAIRAMAISVESTATTIVLVPKSPIHWTPCRLTSTPFCLWHFWVVFNGL
jgi:hypothetical protein